MGSFQYKPATTLIAGKRSLRIVVAIAAFSFLVKCALAFFTYGTNDVTTWHQDLIKASTEGVAALYRDGIVFPYKGGFSPVQVFSHPPAMISVLYFWGLLAELTRLPLQFWMRLSCAIADAASLFAIWKIGQTMPMLRINTACLILIAACPISVMISGFHGNTDPIMMSFVLGTVFFVEKASPKLAGIFFGLALCIKILPLIFAVAFVLYLPSRKARLEFLCAAALVFGVAGLPYLALEPITILRALARYNGSPSPFSLILSFVGVDRAVQRLLFFVLLAGVSIKMNQPGDRPPVFGQAGAIVLLFLAFSPAFAIQYLAWSAPWIVYLGAKETLTYFVISGMFIASAYTHWSGGFPWYAASDTGLGPVASMLMIAWWWMLILLLLMYFGRWRKNRADIPVSGHAAAIRRSELR